MTAMPGCTTCGTSADVRRAHRYPFDRVLSFVRLLPFRCDRCGRRFYSVH